jgi:hypothetical protein
MATITVLVKRNPVVASYLVTLTDQPNANKIPLCTDDFRPYTGGDPAYQDAEVAVLPGFNPYPEFTADLAIYGAGGMSATAWFAIDEKLLDTGNTLKTDSAHPYDRKVTTP